MSQSTTAQAPAGPVINRKWISGHCGNARAVETGAVAVRTPATTWHDRCRGSVIQGNGSILICNCECHAEHPRCRNCGRTGVDLVDQVGPSLLTCVDVEDCASEVYLQATDAANRNRGLRDTIRLAHEDAERSRAEEAVRKAAREANRPSYDEDKVTLLDRRSPAQQDAAPTTTTGKAAKRRVKGAPQRCHHGCGEMTKGGQFAMGHDMKLKGALFEVARGPVDMAVGADAKVDAAAEVIARSWSTKGIEPSVKTAAEARLEKEGWDALVERRVAERYAGAES